MDDRLARKNVVWFLLLLASGAAVAYLNRHHLEQQTNYLNEYVSMADYYCGVGRREILTYPTWGYPFVLLLLPRYDLVVVVQVLLGTLAATAVLARLCVELPTDRRFLVALFVAAVPWYLLHSVKWPLSFAASFVVLAIVVLERAARTKSDLMAAAAGGLLGLALYFRSELLFFPFFVLAVSAFAFVTRSRSAIPVRVAAISASVAWLALVPWGLHCHRETGRFSLTASQVGIVAFISLGQLPGNPWGVVYRDEEATEYLRQRGVTVAPQSDVGNRLLIEEFTRRVAAHPIAFLEKVAWNAVLTLVGGFYGGEVRLSPEDDRQLAELRERLHGKLAAQPAPLASVSDGTGSGWVYVALAHWLVTKALGVFFVVVAAIGLGVGTACGFGGPLLVLLAAQCAYQLLLVLMLATEPRYLNGLYPAMIPFFVAGWSTLRRAISTGRL